MFSGNFRKQIVLSESWKDLFTYYRYECHLLNQLIEQVLKQKKTQLCMKFELLIKTKNTVNLKNFPASKLSDIFFIILINLKMTGLHSNFNEHDKYHFKFN